MHQTICYLSSELQLLQHQNQMLQREVKRLRERVEDDVKESDTYEWKFIGQKTTSKRFDLVDAGSDRCFRERLKEPPKDMIDAVENLMYISRGGD